jgi:2'-5' RNA ligase
MMLLKTPGYQLNEYKLVIPLSESLEHKIYALRKEFGDKYAYKADSGRPHLTLVMFSQLSMMEERIIQKLGTIAMGEAPFRMEMKDFGSFPSHTIFVNVSTKEPIKKLMRSVKDIQRLLRIDIDHKAHFLSDPIISIGRRLKPWQYEKGWLEFSHRQFTGRCIADAMLLLKRAEGTIPWQIAARLELQNLPVNAKQQELF